MKTLLRSFLIPLTIFVFLGCSNESEPKQNKTEIQPQENKQTKLIDKISLNIIETERFSKIDNEYVLPNKGDIFIAYLIEIDNKGDFVLYGGSADYHSTFSIKTNDGFEIQAENTASEAWMENRKVWRVNSIDPGEKGKGWIVFSVPESSLPSALIFEVAKQNSPHNLTGIGKIKIRL